MLYSRVECYDRVFGELIDCELTGDLEDGGECTLKNFWIGESLNEYLGDSIDLTGDLERALLLNYEFVLS